MSPSQKKHDPHHEPFSPETHTSPLVLWKTAPIHGTHQDLGIGSYEAMRIVCEPRGGEYLDWRFVFCPIVDKTLPHPDLFLQYGDQIGLTEKGASTAAELSRDASVLCSLFVDKAVLRWPKWPLPFCVPLHSIFGGAAQPCRFSGKAVDGCQSFFCQIKTHASVFPKGLQFVPPAPSIRSWTLPRWCFFLAHKTIIYLCLDMLFMMQMHIQYTRSWFLQGLVSSNKP